MHAYLRNGVHMCLVDEGAIFLDLSANAYLGIDAATKRALAACLVGLESELAGARCGQGPQLPSQIAPLLARGLLTESAAQGRPFSPLAIPMTHAVPFGTGRPRIALHPAHFTRFVGAFVCASILLRRGRLNQLATRLAELKSRLSGPLPCPGDRTVELVHVARRLSALFYSAKEACLLDSLVLAEFLVRHGHRPTLVFGVRTKPFLAHAWVQLGALVLNDSLEHAQTLTPIAAI